MDAILESFRLKYLHKTFDWKSSNCAKFATDVLTALYGITFPKHKALISGSSKLEIFRYLRQNDLTLSDLATQELGNHINPNLARKGDLVIEGTGLEENMGICYNIGTAMFLKEDGLKVVYTKYCSKAWRVK